MVEAILAVLISVLAISVFHSPEWILTLGKYGGLAFIIYVAIIIIVWFVKR